MYRSTADLRDELLHTSTRARGFWGRSPATTQCAPRRNDWARTPLPREVTVRAAAHVRRAQTLSNDPRGTRSCARSSARDLTTARIDWLEGAIRGGNACADRDVRRRGESRRVGEFAACCDGPSSARCSALPDRAGPLAARRDALLHGEPDSDGSRPGASKARPPVRYSTRSAPDRDTPAEDMLSG